MEDADCTRMQNSFNTGHDLPKSQKTEESGDCREPEPTKTDARKRRVSNGTRTRDNWNHNPGLYQLSYTHRVRA